MLDLDLARIIVEVSVFSEDVRPRVAHAGWKTGRSIDNDGKPDAWATTDAFARHRKRDAVIRRQILGHLWKTATFSDVPVALRRDERDDASQSRGATPNEALTRIDAVLKVIGHSSPHPLAAVCP
jgi:hypothetical protein